MPVLPARALAAAGCWPSDRCTAIVVDKHATVDGSTLTTHNADCLDCDFRVGRTPSATGGAGSLRPVYKYYASYPHLIAKDRSR